MTAKLLILRPIEGAKKTAAEAQTLGLQALIDPLFEIRPLSWNAPSADQYEAIMFTSSNAVKMAGEKMQNYLSLPALVVGPATRCTAEAEGFEVVQMGTSGVQSLVDMLPEGRFNRILRLTGSDFTAVQSERFIEQRAVYEAVSKGLGAVAQQTLRSGSIILIHSVRAAQILVSEMDKLGIAGEKNHVVAISDKVAKASGNKWKSISVAEKPTDEALLTQVARLCSA